MVIEMLFVFYKLLYINWIFYVEDESQSIINDTNHTKIEKDILALKMRLDSFESKCF